MTDTMINVFDAYSLRLLCFDDAEALFNILDTQREQLREWLPFVDMTRKVTDTQEALKVFATPDNPQFCILHQSEVVGLIGFKDTCRFNRKTEIGYWLSAHHQGKGVMGQTVEKLLEYAFVVMNMNRLCIKVAEENVKSNRIPLRLGFVKEGVERAGELLVDGKHANIEVYSMLRQEYIEQFMDKKIEE